MRNPHIGQRVITEHGEGIIDTIAAGNADTDIFQYLITTGTLQLWYYLDEIIVTDAITTP